MDGAGLGEMRHERLVAIQGLKEEKFGQLGSTGATAGAWLPRERIAALVQQAQKLGEQARECGGCAYIEHRWNELIIEDDLFVCPDFYQVSDRNAGKPLDQTARGQQP